MTIDHAEVGLGDYEKKVLKHLGQAWSIFAEMPQCHPDDLAEFKDAIHRLQCLIAFRVAQRVDPSWWPDNVKRNADGWTPEQRAELNARFP